MRRFFGVFVGWSVAATALAGVQDPRTIINTFKANNGYGVASVAGVTSRNGRVSSISGVNFFPSGSNPFYFPMARSGDPEIPQPISFTKEEDGTITAGQIKYGPSGSVSVSSIARSISPKDTSFKSVSKTPNGMFKSSGFKNDMIIQDPFAAFSSRSYNPWFPNTFMFRQPSFSNINSGTPNWGYSNFSPLFNYWGR